MKIAILGPVVTDRYFGGVATFDEALAEGFEELGHKVRIYTSQQGILSNRQLDIMQLKRSKIVEAVNKEKTDLIIASLQFGTLLKKIQTGRKIYFLHGFFNIQSYGIVKTFAATALTKQMTGYADCVIANSSFTATVNQRICNISVDGVAHLGVDKEFIRNVTPTVERNPKELKKILFVGRLAASKHVERIIEAVAMLDNSSYELIIVGDGPERVKLEKLAENLKVSARFLGRLEHDKVSDLYKKCGTFISLGESEPYGLTYAEALLAGCKIVCPITGGQVEFLMNYLDRISFVDVLSNKSIAEGIKKCLETGNVNVNEDLIQKFRYSETAKRILEINMLKELPDFLNKDENKKEQIEHRYCTDDTNMNVELLISTMNINDPEEQIKLEGASGKSVIINQITKEDSKDFQINEGMHRVYSYREKGLSRSRNHAIEMAEGDICTLSDDDMTYCKDYEKIILQAYKQYPDADLIAFSFLYPDGKERHHLKTGIVKPLWTLKLNSAMITFKRESIIRNNIRFDERFGAGSDYPWGEENIFLLDCARHGCKFYYVPAIIGKLRPSNSSWDRHGTPEHCRQQGALYYRMSSKYYWAFIIHFCLFRRKYYIKDSNTRTAIKCMFEGAREFRNIEKKMKCGE